MATARKPAAKPRKRAAKPAPDASPEDLARAARAALAALLASPDERVRLEAAKTALDRFGHPAMARTEITGSEAGGPRLVVNLTQEQARQMAGESDD